MDARFEQTIQGEPASKANSRRWVKIKGQSRFIKSKKALDYSAKFTAQAQPLTEMLDADGYSLCAEITIHYASRRPDLDESLILDLLQGVAYKNDRAVKRKVIEWKLDREKPRAHIVISQLPKGYGE